MVTLRRATPEDEGRLLTWRNEPSTRHWSFAQDEVSPEEHHSWFTRRIGDPDCALLIIEEDDRPVGQIRLDRVTPALAEVSIGLADDARGRGLGREGLRLVCHDAFRILGVTTIRALVKSENEASLRAFQAAGFAEVGEDGGVIELRRAANQ